MLEKQYTGISTNKGISANRSTKSAEKVVPTYPGVSCWEREREDSIGLHNSDGQKAPTPDIVVVDKIKREFQIIDFAQKIVASC